MIGGPLSGIVTNGRVGNSQSMILMSFASLEITITPNIPTFGGSGNKFDYFSPTQSPAATYTLTIAITVKNVKHVKTYTIKQRTVNFIINNTAIIKRVYSAAVTTPIKKIIDIIFKLK